MNNVGKHSGANLVHLCLKKNANTLELEIQNNGNGFDNKGILSRDNAKAGAGLLIGRNGPEFLVDPLKLNPLREQGRLSGHHGLSESSTSSLHHAESSS